MSVVDPVDVGGDGLTHCFRGKVGPPLDGSEGAILTWETESFSQQKSSNATLAEAFVEVESCIVDFNLLYQGVHDDIDQAFGQSNRSAFDGRKLYIEASVEFPKDGYRLIHAASCNSSLQFSDDDSL